MDKHRAIRTRNTTNKWNEYISHDEYTLDEWHRRFLSYLTYQSELRILSKVNSTWAQIECEPLFSLQLSHWSWSCRRHSRRESEESRPMSTNCNGRFLSARPPCSMFLFRVPVIVWRNPRTKSLLLRGSSFCNKGFINLLVKGPQTNSSSSSDTNASIETRTLLRRHRQVTPTKMPFTIDLGDGDELNPLTSLRCRLERRRIVSEPSSSACSLRSSSNK